MVSQDGEWGRKGATLSDKTARAEFGLTQDEIVAAVHAGELQYRLSSMKGNPWLRLLRREVESLVTATRGERYLRERQARAELARVNLDLKRVRAQWSNWRSSAPDFSLTSASDDCYTRAQ